MRHGGSGPPIVLLHGHLRTHATWHGVAGLLADLAQPTDVSWGKTGWPAGVLSYPYGRDNSSTAAPLLPFQGDSIIHAVVSVRPVRTSSSRAAARVGSH